MKRCLYTECILNDAGPQCECLLPCECRNTFKEIENIVTGEVKTVLSEINTLLQNRVSVETVNVNCVLDFGGKK